ncbi:hypothetical protein CEXT_473271 [Caerostris extrusa]|uniref:Restriction endonuclease domain-containing protein n=1 Tax=Caerostris extrusa TaxID=172846 RepID=A0AAV4S663_CAEEX|nr:hypothetical protein CEXT_473271 [Caerostris extrusa]
MNVWFLQFDRRHCNSIRADYKEGEEYMQPVLNSLLEEECILINLGQKECIKFSRFRENRNLYCVPQDLLVFLFDSPPLLLDFEIECVSPPNAYFSREK